MAEISTKPYLIRAIYEWCCDNGYTPHLVVKAGGRARLPMAYVRNGEIVLNVSPTATNGLQMGNDVIEFQARFNGVPEYVVVPVDNVLAIFARETGFVVPFNIGPAAGADADASDAGSASAEGGAAGGPADAGAQPARPGQEGQGTSQGGQAGGGASAPAGGGDVVDFRAARAARPGLKAVPKPGDKDTSDASRPADEEGPKGRGTPADRGRQGGCFGEGPWPFFQWIVRGRCLRSDRGRYPRDGRRRHHARPAQARFPHDQPTSQDAGGNRWRGG